MKRCGTCGEKKELGEFYRDKRRGGVRPQCKSCMNTASTKWRNTHLEKARGDVARWNAARSPEYLTWASMVQRCTNRKYPYWKYYGERGITVCERWLIFANFFKDMGARPPGLTLDRINNDGNYEPGNCRWATIFEQRKNRRPTHSQSPPSLKEKCLPVLPTIT
jgi:hypothetical protein